MVQPNVQISKSTAISCSRYTFEQLAEIYNQARVDYIVPMPMNGKRMAEYMRDYDVDAATSAVALNEDGEEIGVIMLGVRGDRSWITRLGVLPEKRGYKVGQFLMETMIEKSRGLGVRRVQLEVIDGNTPAITLFEKLGFQHIRRLLVIRRPPKPLPATMAEPSASLREMDSDEIAACLTEYDCEPAWTEERASLLNAGNLRGIAVTLDSGETGWLVFQRLAFQLTHFVFSPNIAEAAARALLYGVHLQNPAHDTKIENLPESHPTWPIFQEFGYLEVFARLEMYLHL